MEYTIGQIARMLEVNPSALRYYDQMGIFPDVKKVNGRRVFEDKDFRWLRVLKCMKKIRMPIEKIQEYVALAQQGDKTLKQRYELILEQKKKIEEEMEALKKCYQEFAFKEWYYKKAIEAGTEDVVKDVASTTATLEVDEIPNL